MSTSKLIGLLSIIIVAIVSLAQHAEICGTVVDSITQKVMLFGNVALYDESDQLVARTETDLNGH